jgi:hypothetical protein
MNEFEDAIIDEVVKDGLTSQNDLDKYAIKFAKKIRPGVVQIKVCLLVSVEKLYFSGK